MTDYKFFCEKCKYGTNIKNSFERHNESNYHITGIKTRTVKKNKIIHQCDHKDCNYKTDKTSNFNTHKLNNHATKEERKKEFKYYCDLCDFGVFAESAYITHNESVVHKKIYDIVKKLQK